MPDADHRRFVILSLPRCGSTTLARVLSCHPDIRCLIEPFHPRRYEGRLHRLALAHPIDQVLGLIWTRWNGIKHVWESNGWPFEDRPELNDRIAVGPGRKTLFLIRRNLLRRVVSNFISRQTQYWIGPRNEFVQRLAETELRPLRANAVVRQILSDKEALTRRLESLSASGLPVMPIYYEDLFPEKFDEALCFSTTNSILSFLEHSSMSQTDFQDNCLLQFNPAVNRWASAEIYRRIPNIEEIESEAGSDDTGWLFK